MIPNIECQNGVIGSQMDELEPHMPFRIRYAIPFTGLVDRCKITDFLVMACISLANGPYSLVFAYNIVFPQKYDRPTQIIILSVIQRLS